MTNDPLAGSSWSAPATVAGFASSPPNDVLFRFAERERAGRTGLRALDIGCGAARNALPLATLGWNVLGTDLSWPMLNAAAARTAAETVRGRVQFVLAPMDRLPVRDASCDLVIAHGIWNLARTGGEFRQSVREAARAARDGAALFVFTFSRNTLPARVEPVRGETFVFTQFSGQPQCFLTEEQLLAELGAAGFSIEPGSGVTEYNRPRSGALAPGSGPVIYEAMFRRVTSR